jgi:hypothetical protein
MKLQLCYYGRDGVKTKGTKREKQLMGTLLVTMICEFVSFTGTFITQLSQTAEYAV